jgi:hypothetical protein
MTIFTLFFLRLKSVFLLSLFVLISLLSRAQFASAIYTDYNGYWHSSETFFNPVLPTGGHNLIGFTFGGITYSTDVNNGLLTTNSISFTPGKYKTLNNLIV